MVEPSTKVPGSIFTTKKEPEGPCTHYHQNMGGVYGAITNQKNACFYVSIIESILVVSVKIK